MDTKINDRKSSWTDSQTVKKAGKNMNTVTLQLECERNYTPIGVQKNQNNIIESTPIGVQSMKNRSETWTDSQTAKKQVFLQTHILKVRRFLTQITKK